MKTFRLYSLSNFQICSRLLTIVTVLHITSPWFTNFTTRIFCYHYPFTLTPFLLCRISVSVSIFFFFNLSFCLVAYRVPWPGIRSQLSWNLHGSCGNAECLNTLCWTGDQACVLALQRCHWCFCTTVRIPLVF